MLIFGFAGLARASMLLGDADGELPVKRRPDSPLRSADVLIQTRRTCRAFLGVPWMYLNAAPETEASFRHS